MTINSDKIKIIVKYFAMIAKLVWFNEDYIKEKIDLEREFMAGHCFLPTEE